MAKNRQAKIACSLIELGIETAKRQHPAALLKRTACAHQLQTIVGP
jgi:hypothetical protein